MENKLIKIGTIVNWRGSWGIASPIETEIISISFCETEGDKYGIEMNEIWAADKNRCCFDLKNGHWAYGHQIDLIPENLSEANF